MSLRGANELRARLKALKLAFKPIGKEWADEAVKIGRPKVPVQTGKLRASIRRTHATQRKATVGAFYTAYFIDAGAHYAQRSRKSNRTIFAKAGFRMKPRPFRAYMAREALRRKPMAAAVIREWNRAA